MGGGQAHLAARNPRFHAAGFVERGGFVEHPMLKPHALAADPRETAAARRTLDASTLVALRTSESKARVAAMVTAERLRTAGGQALFLTSSPAFARAVDRLLRRVLSPSAASRVARLTGSSKRADREAAFLKAWVIIAAPEVVTNALAGGEATLARCSLLVVDEAMRAVGASTMGEVARAFRKERPGGLVLALTLTPGSDRRRLAAAMDALGLRQLETEYTAGAGAALEDVSGPIEVLEVELDEGLRTLQVLLEGALAPRAARVVRWGLLAPTALRYMRKRDLLAAAERLRRGQDRKGTAHLEMAHVLVEASLLVEALELLESRGASSLAEFLGAMGSAPDAPRAERSLAAQAGVRNALELSRSLASRPHPKVGAIVGLVRDLLRKRPSARTIVVVPFPEAARALREGLALPPPLGPGIKGASSSAALLPPVTLVHRFDDPEQGALEADLLVFFDSERSGLRAAPRGSPRRTVVLVARDSRDEGALAAADAPGRGARTAVRLRRAGSMEAWAAKGLNRTLPLEAPAGAGGQGP